MARRGGRGARWLLWIALAGAFLTKGFIGPALVVPAILVYLGRERDLRSVAALAPGRGLLLAAASDEKEGEQHKGGSKRQSDETARSHEMRSFRH